MIIVLIKANAIKVFVESTDDSNEFFIELVTERDRLKLLKVKTDEF